MEPEVDLPKGWLALQARMAQAKTPDEVNEVLEEMKQILDVYEARAGRGRRTATPPDPGVDRKIDKS